jgi:hypothetical protein
VRRWVVVVVIRWAIEREVEEEKEKKLGRATRKIGGRDYVFQVQERVGSRTNT